MHVCMERYSRIHKLKHWQLEIDDVEFKGIFMHKYVWSLQNIFILSASKILCMNNCKLSLCA